MALLKIVSDNPDLGWMLCKNPETLKTSDKPFFSKADSSVTTKSWFQREGKDFILYSEKIKSKLKDDFEYLDYTGIVEPQYYLRTINLQLRKTFDVKHEKDTLPVIITFAIQGFEDYSLFKALGVTVETLAYKIVLVTISEDSYFTAMRKAVALIAYIWTTDASSYIEEEQVLRYAPLVFEFIKDYPTLNRFVKKLTSAKLVKNVTSACKDLTIFNFKPGSNFDKRKQAIGDILLESPLSHKVLDIGAGEGNYIKMLSKKYSTVVCYEGCSKTHAELLNNVQKYQLSNVETVNEYVTEVNTSRADILCTEVLEHIEYEQALKLLDSLLSQEFGLAIFTVPNKDFNTYYGLSEDQTRHYDHKWEPTYLQILDLVSHIKKNQGLEVDIVCIGDSLLSDPTVCSTVLLKVVRK